MGLQFTRLDKKKVILFLFSYLRGINIVPVIGEMIMTFPGAFHFGFNLGDNLAEAANFASISWIDYGKTASFCNCPMKKIVKSLGPLNMWKYIRDYQGEDQLREWESRKFKML